MPPKKLKIYIAGKITGLPVSEYTVYFNEVKQQLTAEGFDVVSPLELPHNHDKTWRSYMNECIKSLVDCDCVFALNNWHMSPGAIAEITLAGHLDMKIIYQ